MDSLTQIVLGAAVGEATLGRKVGNRAMLWGGICGTLPDLDVLANAVSDPMSALAYHRAFTHSLAFAILIAPAVGLALHRLYGGREGPIKRKWVWPALFLEFFVVLLVGSYLMPIEVYEIPQITGLITAVFALSFVLVGGLRWLRGFPDRIPNAGWRGWTLLAFFAIATHPILDCFTAYGTQFWQPFAKTRVAWNTISVADPLYTIPFLLLLIWARTRVRATESRARVNRAGIIVSSVYLALTVVNYFNVDHVMKDTLATEGITAEEYVVSPSILNNVLWSGTARAEKDIYYFSQYSLFDEQRKFEPFTRIDGRHDLLAPYAQDRDVRIIRWFTKEFYGVIPGRNPGGLQVNDLRYGLLDVDPEARASYIFSWEVDTTVHPVRVLQENAGPSEDVDMNAMFGRLWERVKGI
ncbi:MAG: metal-dependent hydrolase [Bacteroidota bacterium]